MRPWPAEKRVLARVSGASSGLVDSGHQRSALAKSSIMASGTAETVAVEDTACKKETFAWRAIGPAILAEGTRVSVKPMCR